MLKWKTASVVWQFLSSELEIVICFVGENFFNQTQQARIGTTISIIKKWCLARTDIMVSGLQLDQ